MRLPDGSVALHIGPHKTGTTTMQAALWANRHLLAEQGVDYPGVRRHEMDATMAVALGKVDPGKKLAAHRDHWYSLVEQMQAREARLSVFSSEFYCEADAARRREVLERLGPHTYVIVTLRPIVRLIASQWQQYTQNQLTIPYLEWLRDVVNNPEGSSLSPSFWRRHRHDLLVRRWAADVGTDRLVVVVADERDHRSLPEAFEELLGVAPGSLEAPKERLNRSLTFDEVTLMLEFNKRHRDVGWDQADYNRFIRFGAARGVQARPANPLDQPVLTPQWAIDRALEIGEMMAADIAASGVTVVGSLAQLYDPAFAPPAGENTPIGTVRPDVLAGFASGLINRMDDVRNTPSPRPAAGAVERAAWARRRSSEPELIADDLQRLESRLQQLREALAQRAAEGQPGRSRVLMELTRRLRRRLGR
ncbi:hypothetical protein [Nocardioides limicola]|uniref:hypothetical protein n=1 Tax=Nocardioides limicola TaxID=2803368 RepID=UPI00193C1014|nr:hypothetical protein [Nocardioides sp. DJM-14]